MDLVVSRRRILEHVEYTVYSYFSLQYALLHAFMYMEAHHALVANCCILKLTNFMQSC